MQSETVIPAKPKQPLPAELGIFDAGVPTHRLEQRRVTTCGRTFRIFLAIPQNPPGKQGYPLLYMLDGNAAFDALTADHLAAAPNLALAGIGYETQLRFDVLARTLDYTPAETPFAANGRKTGGAGAFLNLLIGELRAEAESGLAVDSSRRALWGHSLAGMCTLYCLLTRPGAFRRYMSVSPSIWWNDEWMLDFEARTILPESEAEVLVMLGDSERRSNPNGPHWEGPAPHTLEMVERLKRRTGFQVGHDIFAGLGHAATLPASLGPAMALAARP